MMRFTLWSFLWFGFLTTPAVQAQTPDQQTCSAIYNITSTLFSKKADELKPEELALISEVAQLVDDAAHPINRSADRHAQRILKQVRRESLAKQAQLLKDQKSGIPRYEIGIVGVGLHGGSLDTEIEALAPQAKVIAFDAGNGDSRIFDADFFHLNSSETATSGDTPLLYGPIQLRDIMPPLVGHAYPRDRALANGTHFLKASLGSDLLLNNRVESVVLVGNEFLVTTSTGVQAYVRKLAVSVGYGGIKVGFFDEESREIIRVSTEEIYRSGNLIGKAVSFDDLKQAREQFYRAKLNPSLRSRLKQPHPAIDDQLRELDILIMGGSDGGSVVAQKISLLPTRARRYWFGQEGATGEEFIAALDNKKRYADLFDEIESGEIQAKKVRVADLEYAPHPDGRPGIRVTYKNSDGTLNAVIVHTVIAAPGYEEAPTGFLNGMIPKYFANEFNPEKDGLWDVMKAREEKWLREHPEQAQTTPNLYGLGVFGSKATGMFSISRGGSVTLQIAKALTQDIQYTRPLTPVKAAPGEKIVKTLRLKAETTAEIEQPKIALAALRTQILKISRTFAFGSELNLSIRFHGSRAELTLDGFSTGGPSFVQALANDPAIPKYLKDYRKRVGTLSFKIPVTERGGLRMDQSTVVYTP